MDIIYIILNSINSAMEFNNFIDNYLRYWNININV